MEQMEAILKMRNHLDLDIKIWFLILIQEGGEAVSKVFSLCS